MADGTDSDSRHHLSLTTPRDVQGSDNPIPLSPQWLLPNPGENKHGIVTGENNFSPYSGYANHADTMKPSGNGDVWRGPSEHCNNSSNRTHPNGVSQVFQCSSLRVKKLSEKAVLPTRGSPSSAGYDLSSATETKVPARGKALIPTDLIIGIPEGTYAQIAPRSGLAWKHSIDVGAGVIDADYRGPVGVILFNHSDVDIEVKVGDRIAQLIIQKVMTPKVMEVKDLDSTERGVGGFGSTGV